MYYCFRSVRNQLLSIFQFYSIHSILTLDKLSTSNFCDIFVKPDISTKSKAASYCVAQGISIGLVALLCDEIVDPDFASLQHVLFADSASHNVSSVNWARTHAGTCLPKLLVLSAMHFRSISFIVISITTDPFSESIICSIISAISSSCWFSSGNSQFNWDSFDDMTLELEIDNAIYCWDMTLTFYEVPVANVSSFPSLLPRDSRFEKAISFPRDKMWTARFFYKPGCVVSVWVVSDICAVVVQTDIHYWYIQ